MRRRRFPQPGGLVNLALGAGIPTGAALKRATYATSQGRVFNQLPKNAVDRGSWWGLVGLDQATSTSWRKTMTATNTRVRAMSKDTPPIRTGRTTRRTGASTGSVRR